MAHSHGAAAEAVEIVRAGEAETLMKGSLHTDELMAEVVRKDSGLRTERRISRVFIMDVPTCPKSLAVSDASINIFPRHHRRPRSGAQAGARRRPGRVEHVG